MRQDKLKHLRDEAKLICSELENVEHNIAAIYAESDKENELKHLARLIYAGKIVEKAGLLYSFNEQALCLFLATNKSKLEKPPE